MWLRPVVANQTQRLPVAPHQRQTARKIPLVIKVLALVDTLDLPVLRYGVEVPLLVCRPGFFNQRARGFLTRLGADRWSLSASSDSSRSVIRTVPEDGCRFGSGTASRTGHEIHAHSEQHGM